MEIMNFCKTYKLKRSFSILQEIVAIGRATKIMTLLKSEIVEKQQGLPSKLIDLGLNIHLPKSCFRHHVFIEI
jgi:hypothetical protein